MARWLREFLESRVSDGAVRGFCELQRLCGNVDRTVCLGNQGGL